MCGLLLNGSKCFCFINGYCVIQNERIYCLFFSQCSKFIDLKMKTKATLVSSDVCVCVCFLYCWLSDERVGVFSFTALSDCLFCLFVYIASFEEAHVVRAHIYTHSHKYVREHWILFLLTEINYFCRARCQQTVITPYENLHASHNHFNITFTKLTLFFILFPFYICSIHENGADVFP